MRINTNISSLFVQEANTNTNIRTTSSLEKLSTGLRVNKASDDASGLSIADGLRTHANSLRQGISNITSGIALTQIADKAMSEQSNILDIVKQKLIQGITDTTSSEGKSYIGSEITKLLDQLDNIASQTTYNGMKLLELPAGSTTVTDTPFVVDLIFPDVNTDVFDLSGQTLADGETLVIKDGGGNDFASITNNTGGVMNDADIGVAFDSQSPDILFFFPTIQVNYPLINGDGSMVSRTTTTVAGGDNGSIQAGATEDDTIDLPKGVNSNRTGLGLTGLTVDRSSLAVIDEALDTLNGWRADYGSTQNQLESSKRNNMTQVTNTKAAESIIRDVDYAKESANFSKHSLLGQSGSYAQGQANARSQSVLQLFL